MARRNGCWKKQASCDVSRVATEPAAYARTLVHQALVSRDQGDMDLAVTRARAAHTLFENAADASVEERQIASIELAEILRRRSEYDEGRSLVEPISRMRRCHPGSAFGR